MEMKKYYDRERFTVEERESVARKSENRCCHCGKIVYVNYGATVDHFIPLDKGGSNNTVNLLMLCHECNQEKDNKLVTLDYVKYLKDKHFKQLEKYVESYVKITDYAARNRLLAFDEYTIPLATNSSDYTGHKQSYLPITKYLIKLANWNDLNKLHRYFINYLKKNGTLDDEESARENIIFWLQFGCIYYTERNGEINMMVAMTIKHTTEEEQFRGIVNIPYFYLFPLYNTDLALTVLKSFIMSISDAIRTEANLDFILLNIIMLTSDKLTAKIAYMHNNAVYDSDVGGFMCMRYVIGSVSDDNIDVPYDNMTESEKNTYNFLNQFSDINDSLIEYFEEYSDRSTISWMLHGLLSRDLIESSPLHKYIEYAE